MSQPDAVTLYNRFPGEWTERAPDECGCDADPEHGPHTADGEAIDAHEYRALPVEEYRALLTRVEAAEGALADSRRFAQSVYDYRPKCATCETGDDLKCAHCGEAAPSIPFGVCDYYAIEDHIAKINAILPPTDAAKDK